METQRSSIFSKNWRRLLKFKKIISLLGLIAILAALLFGNGILKWTWITPHFHRKISYIDNANGFNYSEFASFENDANTYSYLIGISTTIRDNDGRELGTFTADSVLVDNKMIDISEFQFVESKTTSGLFKFSQKTPGRICFQSGISYTFEVTGTYYKKFSLLKTISTFHKKFTIAFSDALLSIINNNSKERIKDLSTYLTE